MGPRRRPCLLAGSAIVLCSVLALSACSLPGVNASSDATTILAQVQKIQLKDASFNASFTGTLSSQLGGSSSSRATGAGSGKITASPKRADVALNLDAGSVQLPIEVLLNAELGDVYLTSPFISALLGGGGAW